MTGRSGDREGSRAPRGGDPFPIGDTTVDVGQRARLELFVARLATQTPLNLPIEVVNGAAAGPVLWLSAAIHGDELNGVEIIHRVLDDVEPTNMRGVLVAVPVVNVFGFIHRDRYLPDRRDLNRHFPGSARGSLASRLAHLFMSEIVDRSTHGIDLHTGSLDRTNLPQVRGNLDDAVTRRCAEAFGAPIMIHGSAPRKSLREAAAKRGVSTLVYEAGEPQRFNPEAIDHGVRGVLRVMSELNMIGGEERIRTCLEARHRAWVRAPRSGILGLNVQLGDVVEKKQVLGVIRDVFGDDAGEIRSPAPGLVLGHTNNPLISQGDGIIHLARDIVSRERESAS